MEFQNSLFLCKSIISFNTLTMNYLPLVTLIGCFLTIIVGAWLLKHTKESTDPDARRIRFAAATLTGILLVLLYSMSLYAGNINEISGKEIFDKCFLVLPPFGAIVLGFWFGSKEK
jgi:cytochrome bd-type quinol oxidase subunit 2